MKRDETGRAGELHPWRYAAILTFGTAAYLLLGLLGARITHLPQPYVGPLWLSAGFGLALLILWGYRCWPVIAIGAFAVGLHVGLPLVVAGAIAAANVLGSLIAVYLLNNYSDFDRRLVRLRDAVALILIGALLSRLLTSLTATAALGYAGMIPPGQFGAVCLNRWLAGTAGVLVVTPYVLALGVPWPVTRGFRWYAEAAALVLLTAVVTAAAFTPLLFSTGRYYPLAFAPLPLVMWAALRLEVLGAAVAALIVAVICLTGTLSGAGPFARLSAQESQTLLASYNGVVAMTGLLFGSAVAELRQKQGVRAEL